MFSIKRTFIGIAAAFAIGLFAVALPVAGGVASADGGTKSVIESLGTKYTMAANPEIRCEAPGCLGLLEDEGIFFIRCEDQDCLRHVSKVSVPDGGTILLGGFSGIRCEDPDCF